MPRKDLVIKRRAHTRTLKNGRKVRVRASVHSIKDRGQPGRGPAKLPRSPSGGLSGWKAKDSAKKRRRILSRVAKRDGEKSAMARLQLIANFNHRVSPTSAAVARRDKSWVARNFTGNKKVKSPSGLTKPMKGRRSS